MKKVLSILVLVLATVQMAFAGDVITRDAKQLPLTARNFINQYFTKPQISHIKIETGILGSKSYEVLLTDRTEIDFDSNGNWTDVDCKKAAVPAALIPASVKEYVKMNFPQEIITKIERGRSGVEVELANADPQRADAENLIFYLAEFCLSLFNALFVFCFQFHNDRL